MTTKTKALREATEEELGVVFGYVDKLMRLARDANELDKAPLFITAVIELMARAIVAQDPTGEDHLVDLICAELKVGVENGRNFLRAKMGIARAH